LSRFSAFFKPLVLFLLISPEVRLGVLSPHWLSKSGSSSIPSSSFPCFLVRHGFGYFPQQQAGCLPLVHFLRGSALKLTLFSIYFVFITFPLLPKVLAMLMMEVFRHALLLGSFPYFFDGPLQWPIEWAFFLNMCML